MSDRVPEQDHRWWTRLRTWFERQQLREVSRNCRCRHVVLVVLAGVLVVGVLVPAVLTGNSTTVTEVGTDIIAGPDSFDTTSDDGGVREASAVQQPVVDDRIVSLHERGVTGEGTTVGIVGSSFDPTDDAISDGVTRHKSVQARSPIVASMNDPAHDTAVAEVVSAIAPDADIELIAIGQNPTLYEYRTALQLLVDADVDVIVDAGSYFPRDAETQAAFARASDEAAEETVLVTSAGNLGERHWSGTHSGDGWVGFDDGSEGTLPEETVLRDQANQIGDGPIDGEVSLRLHWETVDPAADTDLELYLYRHRPNDPDVAVAKATGDRGLAAIDVTVPRGTYYVAIYRPGGATPVALTLYVPTYDLQYAVSDGSVPPTVGERTILAGAEPADRSAPIRADSSRAGVTLVGPGSAAARNGDLSGTSAAAPYIGGTAALLIAERDTAPEDVRELLIETADRRGDIARIKPGAAIDASTVVTNESDPPRSVRPVSGR